MKDKIISSGWTNLNKKRIKVLEGSYIVKNGIEKYNLLNYYDRIMYYNLIDIDECKESEDKIVYTITNRDDNTLVCKFEYDVTILNDFEKSFIDYYTKEVYDSAILHIFRVSDHAFFNNCISIWYEVDDWKKRENATIFYELEDYFKHKEEAKRCYFWDRKRNKLYKE